MGIFGPETRKVGDRIYNKESEFETQEDAEQWCQYAKSEGFPAMVIPNSSARKFDLYVCHIKTNNVPMNNSSQ